MSSPRETAYAALFSKLSAALYGSVSNMSRTLKHWSDVSPTDMPALFQAQTSQEAVAERGKPTKWILGATLYLYVSTPDSVTPPSTQMNTILDLIDNALAPDNIGQQTLGVPSIVMWARIKGKVETDEGTLGTIAVAKIPVEIVAAGLGAGN